MLLYEDVVLLTLFYILGGGCPFGVRGLLVLYVLYKYLPRHSTEQNRCIISMQVFKHVSSRRIPILLSLYGCFCTIYSFFIKLLNSTDIPHLLPA